MMGSTLMMSAEKVAGAPTIAEAGPLMVTVGDASLGIVVFYGINSGCCGSGIGAAANLRGDVSVIAIGEDHENGRNITFIEVETAGKRSVVNDSVRNGAAIGPVSLCVAAIVATGAGSSDLSVGVAAFDFAPNDEEFVSSGSAVVFVQILESTSLMEAPAWSTPAAREVNDDGLALAEEILHVDGLTCAGGHVERSNLAESD